MSQYHHILMATESLDSHLFESAAHIAQKTGAEVSLIHTCRQLSNNGQAYMLPSLSRIQRKNLRIARQKLAEVGKFLGVRSQNQSIEVGNPAAAILSKAKQSHADLLVIDAKDNAHMLKTMLKRAHCDILAVR